MTPRRVEFGDHTAGESTVRCVRCGHAVVVLSGACVPRCYCGSHEFDVASEAAPALPPAERRPPADDSPRGMGDPTR